MGSEGEKKGPPTNAIRGRKGKKKKGLGRTQSLTAAQKKTKNAAKPILSGKNVKGR